jgi:alpha-N-arabinofuranosidase
LINFDQKNWRPAGNYVVMRLWRDSFAPTLLAVEGPERPLNFVATRCADRRTVYLKIVNPTQNHVEAVIRMEGDFVPKTASFKLIAPGGETVRNTIEQPSNIRAVPAAAAVADRTIRFTMPPLSAGVVRVN